MKSSMQVLARAMFLIIFIFAQSPVLTASSAPVNDAQLNSALPATAGMEGHYALTNPGPAPAPNGYTIAPQTDSAAPQPALSQPYKGLFGLKAAAPLPAYVPQGNLEIEPIAAYNLIVDSNVLAPSSYGPNSATLGARFCNRSGATMNNVWAYIGDYDAVPASRTPGVYPIITAAQAATNTGNAALGAALSTDYGGTVFSLKHQSGTTSVLTDASRYIGTLANNQCVTQYWLVSYPRKAWNGSAWIDVTGDVKPEDDLWLQYDFWATNSLGNTSYYNRYVTMRNEISAMANKIWPNGDNKVPQEYIDAIQQVLGWSTWIPGTTGSTAYPGDTITSQGIWYDMGNIGAGFDNNYDLVPDRNAWLQPIGDASSYDPGCFRLVSTYGLVIVKLNDGTETLIPFVDRLYFDAPQIQDNNTGAVGLVFYQYVALDGACTAGLTPYQEVASGYDNEKFNADFGSGVPPLVSRDTNILLDKSGQTTIGLGGTINYTLTFYLPDIDNTGGNTQTVTVGNPSNGTALTYYDRVPVGLQFVTGSASTSATMANYSPSSVSTTVWFSKDAGLTWSTTDPGNYLSTSTADQLHIKWQLASGITSPPSGAAVSGTVGFSAVVPGGYTGTNSITNNACMKIGDSGPPAEGIVCDPHTTLLSGTSAIEGTVWRDDSVTGGVLGNAIQDGTEAGIGDGADGDATGVTVYLYWDGNGDGDYTDAGDILYGTTTTDSSGNYCFDGTPLNGTCTTGADGLPATSGSARYIIVVDPQDGDIPTGYGPTTQIVYTGVALAASTVYGDATDGSEPSDFGFAPPLSLTKTVATTTPLVVGDTVKYEIAVTNNLPGDGTNDNSCSYFVWSSLTYPFGSPPIPEGSNNANGRWQDPDNARFAPDGMYAYTVLSNNVNTLGISGLNTGNLGGTITSVQYVAYVQERVNLIADDSLLINTWYNDTVRQTAQYFGDGTWKVGGVSQTPGTIFSSGGTGTKYTITRTLDPTTIVGRANWLWTDFTSNLMEFQVIGNKGAGSSNGDINLDAIGFKITTDGNCGSGSSSTLNPVPLTDTFNSSYFTFISADPPVTSSTASSLTWANVGPLYAGQTRIITVYMRATQAGTTTNTDNTATSTGSKFASGIPANSPVTDTATVTIGTNANTRTLSGRVFDDNATIGWVGTLWTNPGTGTPGYDGGDTGIQNIPVDLYACVISGIPIINANANKTCAEQSGTWQLLQTVNTDASGNYSFTNLRQGYYYVAVHSEYIGGSQSADVNATATGICQTLCDNRSNDPTGNGGTEDLEDALFVGDLNNNTAITNVNFGYNVPATLYDIGDTLYLDQNGDSTQQVGTEPGIPGATVNLLGAGGGIIATTATSYQVIDGKLDMNGDGSITSADDGSTAGCTVTDGVLSVCTTYNGFSVVGGSVDVNGNTTGGDSGDDLVAGYYLFPNRPAGTYTVQIDTSTLPAGLVQTDDPDASLDSKSTFSLTTDLLDRDFGYQPTGSGQIGDTVFRDMNGDGTQGGAESGISGVTVVLQISINGAWVTVASDVTDSNGNYLFTGLPAGTFRVVVDRSANSSALPNDFFGNDYIPSNPSSDTTFTNGSPIVYFTKILATNTSSVLTADFAFAPPASIGDTVYMDVNTNGTQDFSEPGIPGVVVTLYTFTDIGDGDNFYDPGEPFYDLDGDTVRDANEPFFDKDGKYQPSETAVSTGITDTTDSDGIYNFTGLTPGYYVAVVTTPPAGGTLTGDPSTDGISCTLLTVNTDPPSTVCDARDGQRLYYGTNYTGADFGYQMPGNFGDSVWIDTDADGVFDAVESGIPEITVTAVTTPPNGTTVNGVLYNGVTTLTLTTETDANGNYNFTGITTSGNITWTVTVSTADLQFPAGLTNTYDPDGVASSSTTVVMDNTGTITNVGGCANPPNANGCEGETDPLRLDADFGYRFVGTTSISGTVCLETTVDGVCGTSNTDPSGVGSGETAFDGVTVYLYKLNDTGTPSCPVLCAGNGLLDPGETTILVGTTTTNVDGDYSFTSLGDGAGVYYVIAIGAPMDGLNQTSTDVTVNGGGDGSQTTEVQETTAIDGDTVSTLQVVNATTPGSTIVDRDFVFNVNGSFDFGDDPISYSTNVEGVPDGARHLQPGGGYTLYLGSSPDTETNGQPTADATGDGSDENGVLIPLAEAENVDGWTDGTGVLQFDVTGSGWLVGWIDWNNDGDFGDANELIISRAVSAGNDQNFNVTAPATIPDGNYYSRFRLFTSQPGIAAFAYAGASINGEVEDYRMPFTGGTPTPVSLTYFKATANGGTVNFEWSTASESANVGFNLYDAQMNRLNSQLIASHVLDSAVRQDYSYNAASNGTSFYIEDVDLGGATRLQGPFTLGEEYGSRLADEPINWSAIQKEFNAATRSLAPSIAINASSAGVNLKVSQTGMYRVTFEALRDAGFDLTNTSVRDLKLTNRGTAVPMYVYARTARFGAGSYIEFYGQALDTLYTGANVYLLQVGAGGARVSSSAVAANRSIKPTASYAETVTVNNQNAYAYYGLGTDPWYDTYMMVNNAPQSWDTSFNVTALANSSAPASLKLTLWGLTQWPAANDHHILVSINGIQVADLSSDGFTEAVFDINIPANTLQEGANTLRLTLPGDRGVNYDVVALDKFAVTYQRTFQAVNGWLAFNAAGKTLQVTNLPSKNVVVYRIDAKGPVRLTNVQFQGSGTNYTATFAGLAQSAKYVVSTVDALHKPAYEAARQPSGLNTPAQYLIISHPNFIDGLQPLVQARRAQGFTVNVVNVNDLYAQYTGGVFDPQAIQQYIAFAQGNLGTQYVLLVGGDTSDYRNYLGVNSISFIPSLYVETGVFEQFVPADALYADTDGDKAPEVAIGRFPVRTDAELALMIQKTLSYGSKDYGQTAVLVADKFDGQVSFKSSTIGITSSIPSGWTVENIFLDDTNVSAANTQLMAAMNRGTSLVTFSGHSYWLQWGFPAVFNTAYASNLTNSGRPFIALQWGCWDNDYVNPYSNSLVHALLTAGDRGAAATLGAVSRADSTSEEMLSQLLTPRIVTPGMTIGQALQLAKADLAAANPALLDVLYGFTIMGDPALVIQP